MFNVHYLKIIINRLQKNMFLNSISLSIFRIASPERTVWKKHCYGSGGNNNLKYENIEKFVRDMHPVPIYVCFVYHTRILDGTSEFKEFHHTVIIIF